MAYFNYKDVQLYYDVYEGDQAVLMIHGWGIDHQYLVGCMEPVWGQTPSRYKRYYIDLPGMGNSIPGFVRNGDDIVEVLLAFIEKEIKDEKILLVGNSFGGHIICELARKIPERISGMLLIAPAVKEAHRLLPEYKVWKKDEAFLNTLSEEERKHFSCMNAVLTKEKWDMYKEYIYPSVKQNEKNNFLNHILQGTFKKDLFEGTKAFSNPSLWLVGKVDNCVGYEDQFELAKQYEGSTYITLDGAGHNLPYDQTELFNQIVLHWLKEML